MKRDEAKLKPCGECGAHACGRMIAKDGSVWPAKDTGYRHQ